MYEFTLEEIIVRIYLYIKKYLWLFVLLTLIGTGIGFYKAHKQKVYYQGYIYVSTGLIYSPRSADYQINALVTDLKAITTHITDRNWVKENFNVDSSSFKSMSVSLDKSNFSRVFNPVKITLKAYSRDDFERFKKGLEYYYTHKSPLLKVYEIQKKWTDTIENILYDDLDTAIMNSKSKILIYLYRPTEQIVNSTYIKFLPLFYFTSDFSSIKSVKSYKQVVIYGIAFLVLAFLISILLEMWHSVKKYLEKTNTE